MSIRTLPTALQARLNGWLDGKKERPSQSGQSISYYITKSLRNHRSNNNHWHEVLCATDFEQKICKMADRAIRKVYEKWQSRDANFIGEQKTWEEKLRQAEENYLIRKRELERDAMFDATPWWYIPIIIIFGIAELAMNAEVFDIFGSARFETIIMALILSFAIPASGHFWGRFLREDEKEKPLIFLSVGCLGVIIFSLYSLAAVRNSYFKIQNTTDAETVFNAWLFFLSLNMLVFLISIYASWYAHERDFKLFKFKRDYMAALDRINKLGSQRNALKSSCHNQIFRIRDAAHERISVYRQHNLRKRSDERRPQAFETLPDILIPEFEEEGFATNGKPRSAYLLTD
jgi:hypothetical protein